MNIKNIRNALAQAIIGVSFAAPLAAHAQAPAPTKGAPAPAAAPAAPPPVVVTPEARVAIKELLDAMNTRDGLQKAYQQMGQPQSLAPRIGEAMVRQVDGSTTLSADQKQKVKEGLKAQFDSTVNEAIGIVTNPKLVDETIEKMYPIYAKYFTIAEIKEMTRFYKTPIGIKTLSTMPQAINESLQAGVMLFTPRVGAVIDRTMKAQLDAVTASTPSPAAPKK